MAADVSLAPAIPNFVFLSHHERERKTSPCTSVYQAFVGPNRIADLAGYVFLEQDREAFMKDFRTQMRVAEPHLLFNGFQSLLRPNSIVALSHALANAIPVTIYWHETAWNLRYLAERERTHFRQAKELLQSLSVVNMVPTSQCLHAVATMFGFSLDTFRIVYEVVDLENFNVADHADDKTEDQPLVIAGAGVPDMRKGIDLFSYIAHTVPQLTKRPVEFRWYSATERRERNDSIPFPNAFRWMGHVKDFSAALKQVDMFVLTSRDDPSPLVVFEALATGHPAFAFATTGFNEMLPREMVALDPDDMCQRLARLIDEFKPNPSRYRAIAEDYSVEKFRERAFGSQHFLQANLPVLDEEIVDFYAETTGEDVDEKINLLREEQRKLIKLMRAVQRTKIGHVHGLMADAQSKSRAELTNIAKRLKDDLKIELYRSHRRKARNGTPLPFPIPFISRTSPLSVVVVANGPSVLLTEMGTKIDKFDRVIRVNNFRTKGFEKFVGSKTDYAVISPACMPSAELSALPVSKVHVFGANLRDDYDKISARLMDKNRGCKVVPPKTNILKPSLYVDAMRMDMNFNLEAERWPSTGVVAVQWARDIHGKAAKIWVHGFDFYADNRVTLSRYFDVTTKADGKHDFDLEKAYLQTLLSKGAIERL